MKGDLKMGVEQKENKTIETMESLQDQIRRLKDARKLLNQCVHDLIVSMQAALIESHHNGAESGLEWIYNALEGPDCLPDMESEWAGDAEDYYNAHRADPHGPCEICGKPSGIAGFGHVACSVEHLEQAQQQGKAV